MIIIIIIIIMKKNIQMVPKWRAEIEISKLSFPLEYKFLIKRENNSENFSFSLPLEWEDKENHFISLQLSSNTNNIVISHNNFRVRFLFILFIILFYLF